MSWALLDSLTLMKLTCPSRCQDPLRHQLQSTIIYYVIGPAG
uniref:Uncharacterized protein n=1 Tax=Trichinella nativa TaxID=6335 RepID=A0A0V1KH46_9BILA